MDRNCFDVNFAECKHVSSSCVPIPTAAAAGSGSGSGSGCSSGSGSAVQEEDVLFCALDVDGDGVVSRADLIACMKQLHMKHEDIQKVLGQVENVLDIVQDAETEAEQQLLLSPHNTDTCIDNDSDSDSPSMISLCTAATGISSMRSVLDIQSENGSTTGYPPSSGSAAVMLTNVTGGATQPGVLNQPQLCAATGVVPSRVGHNRSVSTVSSTSSSVWELEQGSFHNFIRSAGLEQVVASSLVRSTCVQSNSAASITTTTESAPQSPRQQHTITAPADVAPPLIPLSLSRTKSASPGIVDSSATSPHRYHRTRQRISLLVQPHIRRVQSDGSNVPMDRNEFGFTLSPARPARAEEPQQSTMTSDQDAADANPSSDSDSRTVCYEAASEAADQQHEIRHLRSNVDSLTTKVTTLQRQLKQTQTSASVYQDAYAEVDFENERLLNELESLRKELESLRRSDAELHHSLTVTRHALSVAQDQRRAALEAAEAAQADASYSSSLEQEVQRYRSLYRGSILRLWMAFKLYSSLYQRIIDERNEAMDETVNCTKRTLSLSPISSPSSPASPSTHPRRSMPVSYSPGSHQTDEPLLLSTIAIKDDPMADVDVTHIVASQSHLQPDPHELSDHKEHFFGNPAECSPTAMTCRARRRVKKRSYMWHRQHTHPIAQSLQMPRSQLAIPPIQEEPQHTEAVSYGFCTSWLARFIALCLLSYVIAREVLAWSALIVFTLVCRPWMYLLHYVQLIAHNVLQRLLKLHVLLLSQIQFGAGSQLHWIEEPAPPKSMPQLTHSYKSNVTK
jgi:hypothetical protein